MHGWTRLLLGGFCLALLAGGIALSAWQLAGGIAVCALVVAAVIGLRRRARTDRLTGLADRRAFRAFSRSALARGERTAILILDLNETGNDHRTGNGNGNGARIDLIVVKFAEVLKLCVPRPGLICRLSNDRFAVVLTGIDHAEQAYDVAGRIAAALGPIAADGRLVALAAAIGVAVSTPDPGTQAPTNPHDELTQRAERAMLRAKSLGPDTRWAIWREPGAPGTEPGAPAPCTGTEPGAPSTSISTSTSTSTSTDNGTDTDTDTDTSTDNGTSTGGTAPLAAA